MSEHLTTGFVADAMRRRGYGVHIGPDVPITGGAADSRLVAPGDLFTAFAGEHADGNRFVGEAFAAGAVAAICERMPEATCPGRTLIVAPDATKALGELAHDWRRECSAQVVGITGTVGKTTAKDMIAAALATKFRTHKSSGNFNSREGLPLALMSLRRDHEVSVLEMGMDSAGEIAYLCEIAEPSVGVVLNIGLTHVSKLGSVEAIAREKLSLARSLPADGTAVLNLDDERIAAAIGSLNCRLITFGRAGGRSATVTYGNLRSAGFDGVRFSVSVGGRTFACHSSIPGTHTAPAAIVAIGVGMALGMQPGEATDAVDRASVLGRARVITLANGATVIDDRYNSSPESLAGALRMLAELPPRRIALLGRMAELGEFEESEHRRAGAIAGASCDLLLAVGPAGAVLAEAARESGSAAVQWFATKEAAAEALANELTAGDTVLIKASRGEAFETILPILGVPA